jgi:hypothetical protein
MSLKAKAPLRMFFNIFHDSLHVVVKARELRGKAKERLVVIFVMPVDDLKIKRLIDYVLKLRDLIKKVFVDFIVSVSFW